VIRRRCSRLAGIKVDVVAMCRSGRKQKEVARLFGIDKSTIQRWLVELRPPDDHWVCPVNRKCSSAEPHEHCPRCGVILDPEGPREYRPAAAGLCCWCVRDARRHPESQEEAA